MLHFGDELAPTTVIIGEPRPDNSMVIQSGHRDVGNEFRTMGPYTEILATAGRYQGDADEILRDVTVGFAAARLDVDVFVTSRRLLLTEKSFKRANCCTPEEALTVVGLFLRTQGEYTVLGPSTYALEKWTFYEAAAADLLPDVLRWLVAVDRLPIASGGPVYGPHLLGRKCVRRLATALVARDEIHRLSFLGGHVSDLLAQFDWFLLSLVAAFDTSARIAHIVAALDPKRRRYASWRNTGWLKDLAKSAPDLAAVGAPEHWVSDAFDVCAILRNSVHGEGLLAVGEDRRRREDETLVVVPPDELDLLLKVIGRLGGDSMWGVRESGYGTGIAVAQFVDQLIVAAVKALNEIVRLTPVEALPDIDLSDMTDVSRRHGLHALNSSQMRS